MTRTRLTPRPTLGRAVAALLIGAATLAAAPPARADDAAAAPSPPPSLSPDALAAARAAMPFSFAPGADARQAVKSWAASEAAKHPAARDVLAGAAALRAGKYDDAVAALGRATAAEGDEPAPHLGRGAALALLGRRDEADREFARVLQLSRGDVAANRWRAALASTNPQFRTGYARTGPPDGGGDPLALPMDAWVTAVRAADAAGQSAAAAKLAALTADALVAVNEVQPAIVAAAADLVRVGDYRDARDALARVRNNCGTDPAWLDLAGTCDLALGDADDARDEFTRALETWPNLADAYLGRALAAARMGDSRRLAVDVPLAGQFDPAAVAAFHAAHDAELASLASRRPATAPAGLTAALLDAARHGEAPAALADRAGDLIRSTNATRRVAAEQYADRLLRYQWAVWLAPTDASAWTDLATFVYLGARVQRDDQGGEGVERVRNQPVAQYERERQVAEQYADRALALDPHNPDAMATKAWLLEMRDQHKDALDLAEAGLQVAPDYPRLAKLKSILLAYSAIQANAEAERLRQTHIVTGDGWFIVYPPSPADLEKARDFESRGAVSNALADAASVNAFRRYRGTVAGYNRQGDYYDYVQDYDKAVAAYEQALRLDPDDRQALDDLSDEYAEHFNDPDKARAYHLRALATETTTATPLFERAAQFVAAAQWDHARQAIADAAAADPADPRGFAYAAVVDSWESKLDDASARWRCTMAMEEARMRLRGASLSPRGAGPVDADDAKLYQAARLGLFRAAMVAGRTDDALKQLDAFDGLQRRSVQGLSGRNDTIDHGLPKPNDAGGDVPPGEDLHLLIAKALLIRAKQELADGKDEQAARDLTVIYRDGYIGGDDPEQTRAFVDDNSYRLYEKLKPTHSGAQLAQLFDSKEVLAFENRDFRPQSGFYPPAQPFQRQRGDGGGGGY